MGERSCSTGHRDLRRVEKQYRCLDCGTFFIAKEVPTK